MKNAEGLPPRGEWRPFRLGRPKNGYIIVNLQDGTRWQRPMTAAEIAARGAAAKPIVPKAPPADAVRLTVPRMADGFRTHMQHREGFDAVMEAALLSEKAISNLILWLNDWQDKAAQRAIAAKRTAVAAAQEAARKVESELQALVDAASKK
jgi:type II secretory pathway component HofQ